MVVEDTNLDRPSLDLMNWEGIWGFFSCYLTRSEKSVTLCVLTGSIELDIF
jgi:hypothetical protein